MRPTDLDLPANMQKELEPYHDEHSPFIGDLLQTGAAILQSQQIDVSADVKSNCGNAPLFGKDKWRKCVQDYEEAKRQHELALAQQATEQKRLEASQKKGISPAVWIVGGLVVVGAIVTIVIVRKRRKG